MKSDRISRPLTFLDALLLMFIGLKLSGAVAWSWWVTLSPILIPLALFLVLGILRGIIEVLDKNPTK